jgi:hypothetical protein
MLPEHRVERDRDGRAGEASSGVSSAGPFSAGEQWAVGLAGLEVATGHLIDTVQTSWWLCALWPCSEPVPAENVGG